MVESVNKLLRIALALAGMMVLSATAIAETLGDPTRPPAALIPAQSASATAHAAPALQSVLISHGRRIAIINGKEVRVNDLYNGARVVKILESEVVLRNGRDVQVLKLFPDVDKRATRHGARNSAGKHGRKRQVKE